MATYEVISDRGFTVIYLIVSKVIGGDVLLEIPRNHLVTLLCRDIRGDCRSWFNSYLSSKVNINIKRRLVNLPLLPTVHLLVRMIFDDSQGINW